MAFSAIMSVWPTSAEYYNLLRVVQNPAGTDISIEGELSPSLKSEMRAVLMQLCDGTNTVAGRANIILDALDDLVVTDLEDNVITSSALITDANTKVALRVAGSVSRTNRTVMVVMPQSLIGIYAGSGPSPGDILLQTGVLPGTYTNATITVRADGRIEAAETGVGGGSGGSLTAGSVTSTYLATGAVTTAKIADSAVTDAKIGGVAAAKVTGLSAVATSGDYADLSGAPDLSGYLTASDITGKLDSSTAASTYATQTDLAAKLDSSTAASTYLTASDLSSKLDSSTAASTYATQTDLAAKLDSSTAASTYVIPSAIPYDVALDYMDGAPTQNEVLGEITLARAVTLGAPASHYVKTLVAGERPATNGAFVVKVYRNSTEVVSVTYQSNGTAVVAEPASTVRAFAAGDVFKITCTANDGSGQNPKITFSVSLA